MQGEHYVNAAAKPLQSCPTLCNPMDSSSPGSAIPGILQARTLEWVAISFSSAWKWKVKSLSRVRLFATPWTAAYQTPPSMDTVILLWIVYCSSAREYSFWEQGLGPILRYIPSVCNSAQHTVGAK